MTPLLILEGSQVNFNLLARVVIHGKIALDVYLVDYSNC